MSATKMDELEFRQRVYSNPHDLDKDVLEAANNNPAYQNILKELQELDTKVGSLLNNVAVPAELAEKLLAIPDQTIAEAVAPGEVTPMASSKQNFFQYYAMAACLLLAVGVTFSLIYNGRPGDGGPTANELAFADEILAHLYVDVEEIDALNSGTFIDAVVTLSVVNEVMANAGTQLRNSNAMQALAIRSAKPCEILAVFQSAHLLVQGNMGAVSVIVINNSPVSAEYKIGDGRFTGVVVPMSEGNMILVGEINENLDLYKNLFADNVEWII